MDAYHVYECVGVGSFGKVYRGRRKFTGQFVAIKVIPKAGKSTADLLVLRREAAILRQLDHVNIILLLDYFETARELVLVTEFAHGELLQILQDDGSLPPAVVRSIARQLTSALRYLHEHRIAHRDLKPQNVLVGSGGVIKLCDFGFAAELGAGGSLLASLKGTPLYIAPEVFSGGEYDLRADLWSLGVLVYELAVGRPPYYAASLPELARIVGAATEPPFPPGAVPPDCEAFLRRLLVKDAAGRADWPELAAHAFLIEHAEGEEEGAVDATATTAGAAMALAGGAAGVPAEGGGRSVE